MSTSDLIATGALVVSLFALGFSYVQWRRLTQEAFIKALQGEKASVAYVASWIAQNGIPPAKRIALNSSPHCAWLPFLSRLTAHAHCSLQRYGDTVRSIMMS